MVFFLSRKNRRLIKHWGDYIYKLILFRPGLPKFEYISFARYKAGLSVCHYRMLISLPWKSDNACVGGTALFYIAQGH